MASSSVPVSERLQLQQQLLESDIAVKAALQDLTVFKGNLNQFDAIVTKCRERIQAYEGLINAFEASFVSSGSGHLSADASGEEELRQAIQKNRLECALNQRKFRQLVERQSKSTQEGARADLFDGGTEANSSLRKRKNNSLLKETAQVTDSLSSLLSEVNTQVKRSEQNLGLLVSGSETMAQTETELHQMGAVIKTSGRLLTKYGSRECTDKLLLCLCLLMFYGVCIYIIRKRLF